MDSALYQQKKEERPMSVCGTLVILWKVLKV